MIVIIVTVIPVTILIVTVVIVTYFRKELLDALTINEMLEGQHFAILAMFRYFIVLIYWFFRIPSGVLVRTARAAPF